jgi:hypothetical protein
MGILSIVIGRTIKKFENEDTRNTQDRKSTRQTETKRDRKR